MTAFSVSNNSCGEGVGPNLLSLLHDDRQGCHESLTMLYHVT